MNHEDITFPCYKSNTFLSLHLFWDVLHPIPVHPKKGDKTRDGESMSIGDAQPIQIHNKENCGESIPEEFDIVKHHDGLKEMKKTIEDVRELVLKLTKNITIGTPTKTPKQGHRLLYAGGDAKRLEKKTGGKKLFSPLKKIMKPTKVL